MESDIQTTRLNILKKGLAWISDKFMTSKNIYINIKSVGNNNIYS